MPSPALQRWLDEGPDKDSASPIFRSLWGKLVEERFPVYHLKHEQLLEYLKVTFPVIPVQITIHEDDYVFQVPRYLSAEERNHITRLRSEARDRQSSDHEVENDLTSTDASITDIPIVGSDRENTLQVLSGTEKNASFITYTFSGADFDPNGTGAFFYRAEVSEGLTCKVFKVDALWSWVSKSLNPIKKQKTVKVAVKRLSADVGLKTFKREYEALLKVSKIRHRNIVDLFNAFRYVDGLQHTYYNFCFPLATCNLKELFYLDFSNRRLETHGSYNQGALVKIARNSLWTEFEGLASALAYLHNECEVVHADIKPSNILLYWTESTPPLVAKLADFGQTIDLHAKFDWHQKTQEYLSAWQYSSPEVRDLLSRSSDGRRQSSDSLLSVSNTKMFKGGDIWKLGAVFTELLTFLTEGQAGVVAFRSFITTTMKNSPNDEISDSRFDDGKTVKLEVLEWLSRLSKLDPGVQELYPLLKNMLGSENERPTAVEVSTFLQASSFCFYFSDLHGVRITQSPFTQSLPLKDRFKERIEDLIKHKISWWPFKDGYRTCRNGNSRISWVWNGSSLYIDVSIPLADEYRHSCRPLSQAGLSFSPSSSSRLDTTVYSGSNREATTPSGSPNSGVQGRTSSEARPQTFTQPHPLASTATAGSQSTHGLTEEISWCVDKAWSEPRETKLCSIESAHYIFDDQSLCKRLIGEYSRIRTWKGRFLSWKTCLGVDFIEYVKPFAGQDEISRLKIALPPAGSSLYNYHLTPPEEVHMRMAEIQLVRGMHNPSLAAGTRTTLLMIPKKVILNPSDRLEIRDWGIHAQQHFSFWKILIWYILVLALGLLFVILWLVFVDSTDL